MQNRKNIGYDETKRMLNTMRRLNESVRNVNTLREQVENPNPTENIKDNVDAINDVDVKLLSSDSVDMELSDNHKNSISGLIDSFRQQVSELANLEPGFTINMDQIRLDGSLSDLDLNFVFIAGNESGVYLNADMLTINEDVLLMLEKLVKFQLTFQDTLNPIIRERNNN